MWARRRSLREGKLACGQVDTGRSGNGSKRPRHKRVRPIGSAAGWLRSVGKTWLGNDLFTGTTGALASSLLVLGVLWTFCGWLYRRKVFIRI
jgi:hypothetical protein